MDRNGAVTLSSFRDNKSKVTKKSCVTLIEKLDTELINHDFKNPNDESFWDRLTAYLVSECEAEYFIIDEELRLEKEILDTLILILHRLCGIGITIFDINEDIHLNSNSKFSEIALYCSKSIIKSEKKFIKSNTTSKVWIDRIDKIEKGEKPLLNCPQWIYYDELSREYKLNSKADIVRDIFERIVNGNTMNKIAVDLNAEKVKTIGNGKAWSVGSISWILKNRSSMGTLCIKDREFDDFFPAAVSREVFSYAHNELKRRSQRRSVVSGNTNANLVTGLAECGECGAPMHLQGSFRKSASGGTNDYRYLICSAQRANKGACDCKPFRYEFFEIALSVILSNSQFLDISTSESDNKKSLENNIEHNRERLTDLKSRLVKLVDALSIVESSEIKEKIKALDNNKIEIVKLIEDDERSLYSMSAFEPKMTLHEKMQLMSAKMNSDHNRASIIALLGRILTECKFYSTGIVNMTVAGNEIKLIQSGKGINVMLPNKTINFERK